jgi:hypothetical protein
VFKGIIRNFNENKLIAIDLEIDTNDDENPEEQRNEIIRYV